MFKNWITVTINYLILFLSVMLCACEKPQKDLLFHGKSRLSSTELLSECNVKLEKRIRFLEFEAPSLAACKKQTQTRTCDNGNYGAWNGEYQYKTCNGLSELSISSFEYVGGFRLSSKRFGKSKKATLNYSPGVITFNPKNNSLFVVGHGKEQGIAEFTIPEVVNTKNISDFAIGNKILQNFAPFHNTERVDTGIKNNFRVTGLALIEDQLIVNYINWYDASGKEIDTSVIFKNAENLVKSDLVGPFQLNGAAHAAGWLTPIPAYWRNKLGGSYLSGYSGGSVISRLSVGPSAFVLSPEQSMLNVGAGRAIQTEALLDFDLKNILYDKSAYGESYDKAKDILYNKNLQNSLWTIESGAAYGFIVPGTNTYITFGYSGGHKSVIGYKIRQDNGYLCPGPCPSVASDIYNYVWLWHVDDLLKVKNGLLKPYEVRPYQHGPFETLSKAKITGGTFDEEKGLLYLSLKRGDTVEKYKRPPLFLVYKIKL